MRQRGHCREVGRNDIMFYKAEEKNVKSAQ